MKSKFLIGLLTLALTACGGGSGSGGLIKGGQDYSSDQQQKVQAVEQATKEEVEEGIKGVTINEKSTINYSVKGSYGGQSYSYSMAMNEETKYVLNFEQKTIELTQTATTKMNGQSQTEKAVIKAKNVDGMWTVTEGQQYDLAYSIGYIYEGFCETIYSWNFLPSNNDFDDLFDELGSTGVSIDAQTALQELYNSFVISGDPESGTFQVGLGKAINLQSVIGYPAVIDSLMSSFKNYLAQSMSMSMHMSMSEQGASVSMKVSESMTFSYSK